MLCCRSEGRWWLERRGRECGGVAHGSSDGLAMKKIRVGVIGTGAFAETCHVPGLQSHPQAEVIVLCGRNYARTHEMAQRLNVPEVTTDFEELCARTDIDAVTIATANVFHARQTLAALAARKHVFCEKPMAMNVTEALQMVRAAQEAEKIHQVAFTYRYLYGVQELKRRLDRGDIGVPFYMRLQYDSWDGLHPEFKAGFRDNMNLAGGGVLYDVGSHLFDLARFILGPIEAVNGFATLVPRGRTDNFSGGLTSVETDDFAGAWFVSENAVRGQWFASRVTPCIGDKAFVEVIGSEGALKVSLSRGSVDTLKVSRPTRPDWENLPLQEAASDGKTHCLSLMMRSFVEACLRGTLDPRIDASFYDGLAAQQALAAVTEATSQPDWIRLKPLEKAESDQLESFR